MCWWMADFNRWLIPSTIPGASQLFKTLLTWGDNPVKAVKDHVLRRRGRQLGNTEGLKGSVNVSTLSNQNDRADLQQDHFDLFVQQTQPPSENVWSQPSPQVILQCYSAFYLDIAAFIS